MHPLDNPVWQALNSADSRFNLGDETVGYLPADISPFAALPEWSETNQAILYDRLPEGRSWSAMVREQVEFAPQWELKFTTTLHQMVCSKLIPVETGNANHQLLNTSHVPAMLALTELTKPGPFMERTIEFGNYHGIFDGDELIAITGERLHLDDYTEVSAVCTHPDYAGKGYGALLVSIVAAQIIEQGKTPFLHVKWDNQRAIKMYERLGFVHRCDIYFGVFKRR
ncbi:MAG: GNAT family N-acetyltransferase [Bacteroidota bacterium]